MHNLQHTPYWIVLDNTHVIQLYIYIYIYAYIWRMDRSEYWILPAQLHQRWKSILPGPKHGKSKRTPPYENLHIIPWTHFPEIICRCLYAGSPKPKIHRTHKESWYIPCVSVHFGFWAICIWHLAFNSLPFVVDRLRWKAGLTQNPVRRVRVQSQYSWDGLPSLVASIKFWFGRCRASEKSPVWSVPLCFIRGESLCTRKIIKLYWRQILYQENN